jgi:Carboxypeptidase regulatory-like domain/TonB dependent receptor
MNLSKLSFRAILLLAWAVLFVAAAHAQYRAGISGVVTDPQGAVVTDAKVTVTAKDTGLSQEATTDQNGVYTVNRLAPGLYTIAVEKSGFQQKLVENVNILAEQVTSMNVTLEVGQVTQSVTVNGSDLPAIDTETGQISGTLSSNEVQNLPSMSRDPFQLLRLAPGVFGDSAHNNGGFSQNIPGSAGPGGPSAATSIFATENQVQAFANGQRNEANGFAVDGVSVNSLDWGGAATITPNEESVKEVKITANSYDAEYGRNSAAQVEVVSQSGTNQYHGSIFFKMDRPGLNSYQGYNGPSGPAADQRVPDRFNQIGGSVGGPIIHNKLFAFFSYETLRNNSVRTGTTWVETPQYLKAVGAESGFIAGSMLSFPGEGASFNNVLPSTCAQINMPATNCQAVGGGLDIGSPLTSAKGTKDPTFGQVATPFGIGNGLDGVPDIEFVQFTNPTIITATQYNGRVDYQLKPSDLVTFSIYWVPNDTTNLNGQARAANLYHSDRLNYSSTVLWNHTFGATLLNEARFNVSRWYFNEIQTNPQEPWGLPTDTITGLPGAANQIVFGAPGPGVFYKTAYNIRDTVRKVLNRHSLKFGVDIYKEQNTQTQAGGARPTYNFNDLWDFANDAPFFEFGQFNPVTGIPTSLTSYVRDNDFAIFGQDDYKLKPNLTINLGLRWEYFGPFHEKNGNLATPVLGPAPNQLAGLKVRLGGDLYNADKHNFGPQIGFAWSPHSLLNHDFQNRLVVRGGFGIGYNRLEDAFPLGVLGNPSPLFASFGLVGSNIVYAVPSNPHQFAPYPANPNAKVTFNPNTNLPTGGAPVQLAGLPANVVSPYTYRYSLETQYDLGHNMVATVGYAGSMSRHLFRWVFQGQILFSPQNPVVNNYRLFANDVNGNYNALLTQLQKRFSHGFELDAQYTFSRANDDASTDFFFDSQYPFNAGAAYGPSDYDATHNFKFWGVWTPRLFEGQSWKDKVMGGWTFSGILSAHSGFPWTPFYNVSVTGTPSGNTCSLLFDNSNYCGVRPAAYLGGALSSHSNNTLEQKLGEFPNGPATYFTPPALTATGVPPVPGVGRNSFRGPRYASVDFTLAKAFGLPNMKVIGENSKLELRLNFYNLFNQVNLAPIGNQPIGTINLNSTSGVQTNPGPPGNPGSSTFDQACCGLAGRVVEAQIRFSF